MTESRLYNPMTACLLVVVLALGGCASPTPPAPPPEPATAADIPADAIRYRILEDDSLVEIAVYPDGPLAHLGHHHLITASRIEGSLWRHDQLAKSGFALRLAVNALTVDDNEARMVARDWAGAGFVRPVSAEARQATRRNMLGPEVLDSANHPWLSMHSLALENREGTLRVTAEVSMRGQRRQMAFDADLKESASQLQTSGLFRIQQSDFGIAPYSVGLGALRVKDEVRVRFKLKAVRE